MVNPAAFMLTSHNVPSCIALQGPEGFAACDLSTQPVLNMSRLQDEVKLELDRRSKNAERDASIPTKQDHPLSADTCYQQLLFIRHVCVTWTNLPRCTCRDKT